MNTSDKKTFSSLAVSACAIILIALSVNNRQIEDAKAFIVIFILVIAAGALYLIHRVIFKDYEINREVLKKMTEKDYLEQMAEDMRTMKIITMISCAMSIASVLAALVFFIFGFSRF